MALFSSWSVSRAHVSHGRETTNLHRMTESEAVMSTACIGGAGCGAETAIGGASPHISEHRRRGLLHTLIMSSNKHPYAPSEDDSTVKLLDQAETDESAAVQPVAEHTPRPSIDYYVCVPVWIRAVPIIAFVTGQAAATVLVTLITLCFEEGRKRFGTADLVLILLSVVELAVFAFLYRLSYVTPITGPEAAALYDPTRARFQYVITLSGNPEIHPLLFFVYGWGIYYSFSEYGPIAAIRSLTFVCIALSMGLLIAMLRKRPLRRLYPGLPLYSRPAPTL